MKNIPERIFLQTDCTDNVDFDSLVGVSWCSEMIYESDIEYIRLEKYNSHVQELKTTIKRFIKLIHKIENEKLKISNRPKEIFSNLKRG